MTKGTHPTGCRTIQPAAGVNTFPPWPDGSARLKKGTAMVCRFSPRVRFAESGWSGAFIDNEPRTLVDIHALAKVEIRYLNEFVTLLDCYFATAEPKSRARIADAVALLADKFYGGYAVDDSSVACCHAVTDVVCQNDEHKAESWPDSFVTDERRRIVRDCPLDWPDNCFGSGADAYPQDGQEWLKQNVLLLLCPAIMLSQDLMGEISDSEYVGPSVAIRGGQWNSDCKKCLAILLRSMEDIYSGCQVIVAQLSERQQERGRKLWECISAKHGIGTDAYRVAGLLKDGACDYKSVCVELLPKVDDQSERTNRFHAVLPTINATAEAAELNCHVVRDPNNKNMVLVAAGYKKTKRKGKR